MEFLTDPQTWIALVTLTILEIVLGIDNIIFIAILAEKLPPDKRERARKTGLLLAMVTRLLLLTSIAWLIRLTNPLFHVFGFGVSGRSIILILGGLFLLGKSTYEIHDKLEGESGRVSSRVEASFGGVIVQILLLDVVFSLDSVITAVGMANELAVMIAAVIIAVIVMLYASGPISEFISHRPTLKVLALSFLLLIGVSLIAEGLEFHIPKGYIYFAMGFSFFVEMLNQRLVDRTKSAPVLLRQAYVTEKEKPTIPNSINGA